MSDNPVEALAACGEGLSFWRIVLKTVLLIDGGYLRAWAKKAGKAYDNTFIQNFANSCFGPSEYFFRAFYYDAPQFRGKATLPVSGNQTKFTSNDGWLRDLAKVERFAVRRGTLGFRGWRLKNIPIGGGTPLTDADFSPIFEQKGVDMRIGLDISSFAHQKSAERVLLVSGDQDMIPAMKEARKAGLEVGSIQLAAPAISLHDQIICHSDFVRPVPWP